MMNPETLLQTWHDQQTGYIEMREMRTRCMVDVLARLRDELGRPLRVLDLACGPASLGTAVLERLPDSWVTGVDRDPVLLRLARETNRFGERLVVLDRDLTSPTWTEGIGPFDAAVSATALHWLDPQDLVACYQRLPEVLAPGAHFMNADHLDFDTASQPALHALSLGLRSSFEARAHDEGVLDWDQWWEEALTQPGWEAEAAKWRRRWADKHRTTHVSVEFHLAALRAAGFAQTGQIFQWFDDRVVWGKLPDEG